ncbi:hypothetical protein HanRHA438_Chr01g0020041 [Helianthus annuus]|nr:hypothetical protein HanRHA438_Chr01g0020041 [Helianthus annuus]
MYFVCDINKKFIYCTPILFYTLLIGSSYYTTRYQHELLLKLDCINTRHHVVSTLAKEIKDKIVDMV